MKFLSLAILAIVAVCAIVSMQRRPDSAPAVEAQAPVYKPNLSTPLGIVANEAIICPGSASAGIQMPSSTNRASSFIVYNSSSTCVRIGGSGITSTTGVSVGSGCDLGTTFSMDARNAYCVSSGVGTVTVQVLYGAQ